MQALRRWSPPSKAPARAPASRAANDQADSGLPEVTDRDLAFCAEFEARGGIAESEKGFKAEEELIRMERAGLLSLARSDTTPYAVTRVKLSAVARRILGQGTGPVEGLRPPPPPAPVATQGADARRHAFEIARGMIGAAVKAELSELGASMPPAAAARLMDRITCMPIPF